MPAAPTLLGVAVFSGIKLIGYSFVGAHVNRKEALSDPRPLVFGVSRTIVGLAVGIPYAFALGTLEIDHTELIFFAGLLPVRILEWLGVFWLFYRRVPGFAERRPFYVAKGVAMSFILDLPASLAAIAIPGGFWIC